MVNPDYEVVQINAKLDFVANVAINRLCQQIAEQLKIYLSPWIQSGELIDFLSSWDEVTGVSNLTVTIGGHVSPQQSVIKLLSDTSVLASATHHNITQTEAA